MAWKAHCACLVLALACLLPVRALAQGETTSAIVGEVRDATNAVVAGATVTNTNHETGLRRSAKTDDAGRFNFPQLKPGTYSVTVEARGFDPGQNDNVVAGLGQKQTVDFTLKVARSNEAVEVRSEAPLINLENANTSTTLSAPALEDLPNPGGDLTYPLQFAPGALINTAGSSNDFVGGQQRVWQRGIQRTPRPFQWLHRGRVGNERSAHQSQQRPLHQPCPGTEFYFRSDRQHSFVFHGSRPLWRIPGQLRDQIRGESVSRKSLRTVEWSAAQCHGLLHQCDAGESQAGGNSEPFWRQCGWADRARQTVLLL
jgi:hypothetical protein